METTSDVGSEDKTTSDVGSEDKTTSDLGSEVKTTSDVGSEDKTTSDVGSEDKTTSDGFIVPHAPAPKSAAQGSSLDMAQDIEMVEPPDHVSILAKEIIAILKPRGSQGLEVDCISDAYCTFHNKELDCPKYGVESVLDLLQLEVFKKNNILCEHFRNKNSWVVHYQPIENSGSASQSVMEVETHVKSTSNESKEKKPVLVANPLSVDVPKAPKSAASSASKVSNDSSVRTHRLPPPPPSIDWSPITASILGKRKRTGGPNDPVKKSEMDDLTSQASTIDESPPPQDLKQLEDLRKKVTRIGPDRTLGPLTFDNLILGRKMAVVTPAIFVDTTFCERSTLEKLMGVKYEIRKAGADAFRNVQLKANNFGDSPAFFFSSAYNLASIDVLCNNCVTDPKKLNHKDSLVGDDELLYVVDIQGGPGGFVEYVLTKKKWEAKIFGFSSRYDDYNYEIQPSGHFPKESFDPWYGFSGTSGDGNIYKPDFVSRLCRHVRMQTNKLGVHVVMANGGEKSSCDEDRKELRCKSLLMAEAFIAMKCLREGGNFIFKAYDMLTPFSVGLVYLMYRSFNSVAIIRPETCTFASSERYVVCQGFKGGQVCKEISNFLESCHQVDWGTHVNHKYPNEEQAEIVELVPVELLKSSEIFYDYIYDSNVMIGRLQLHETFHLTREIVFNRADSFIKKRIAKVRENAARIYNCPRRLRQAIRHINLDPMILMAKLLRPYPEPVLRQTERNGEVELTMKTLHEEFTNPAEWNFVSVGRDRGFYLCMGGNKAYRFSGGEWKLVKEGLDIADHTFVYADMVDEILQLENKQVMTTGFHIIDALHLGGKDVRNLSYQERIHECMKFAKSMNKRSRDDLTSVRAKRPVVAANLKTAISSLSKKQVMGKGDGKKHPLVAIDPNDFKSPNYALTGYLMLKTKKGLGNADFLVTMQNRIYWKLDNVNINPAAVPYEDTCDNQKIPNAATLIRHIDAKGY